jgi:hypothetical protein
VYEESEHSINAKGLTGNGPRMMVDGALQSGRVDQLRVVVTDAGAVEDLKRYFGSLGAAFEIDEVGEERHFLVDLTKKR